jgi:hypothetical protein
MRPAPADHPFPLSNQEIPNVTDANVAAFPQPHSEPLFVPVAHVVARIVKETMDAVEASKTDETPNLKTWTDAAVELVNQHPSKLNLISWLATQGIENALCMEASERDLDYAVGFGSPEIEATEADVKHSQAMVEEYEEIRRSNAKSS